MTRTKKILLTAALITVLAVLGAGGTLAWLSTTEKADNGFTVGIVNIGITENSGNPLEGGSSTYRQITAQGQQVAKQVQVKNLDTPTGRAVPAYIRARVVPTWRDANGNSIAAPAEITLNGTDTGKWVLRSDGYYYYKSAVDPNASTTYLMQSVTVNSAVPNGAHLEIQVIADAVQAESGAAHDAWGIDPTAL